eukprot:1380443-Rhodomonas_salina.2
MHTLNHALCTPCSPPLPHNCASHHTSGLPVLQERARDRALHRTVPDSTTDSWGTGRARERRRVQTCGNASAAVCRALKRDELARNHDVHVAVLGVVVVLVLVGVEGVEVDELGREALLEPAQALEHRQVERRAHKGGVAVPEEGRRREPAERRAGGRRGEEEGGRKGGGEEEGKRVGEEEQESEVVPASCDHGVCDWVGKGRRIGGEEGGGRGRGPLGKGRVRQLGGRGGSAWQLDNMALRERERRAEHSSKEEDRVRAEGVSAGEVEGRGGTQFRNHKAAEHEDGVSAHLHARSSGSANLGSDACKIDCGSSRHDVSAGQRTTRKRVGSDLASCQLMQGFPSSLLTTVASHRRSATDMAEGANRCYARSVMYMAKGAHRQVGTGLRQSEVAGLTLMKRYTQLRFMGPKSAQNGE